MRIACLACSFAGTQSAAPRGDQHCCQEFRDRFWGTALSNLAVKSSWRRKNAGINQPSDAILFCPTTYPCAGCKQHRQILTTLPPCCLFHSKHQTTRHTQNRQVVSIRPHAIRYDLVEPPEPSSKPVDACKRWLQSVFPILRNEELVSKVFWTLMVIAIARLGQQLTLPYVDANLAPQGGVSSMLQCNPPYSPAGYLGLRLLANFHVTFLSINEYDLYGLAP